MNHRTANRVIISVFSDLATDQRVQKTARTLESAGFDVKVIARKLPGSPEVAGNLKHHRIKVLFHTSFLAYAEWNIRLFFYLLFHKKNFLQPNDLDTLPANYLTSILTGTPLVYDSHELFTEIPELIDHAFVRKVWASIEAFIFPRLKHVYTVSPSVAKHYENKYGVHVDVVRNLPSLHQNVQTYTLPDECKGKKIILYQGAINPGRGLEKAIDAMQYLDDSVLVIAGSGPLLDTLQKQSKNEPLSGRVFFTGRLDPDRLRGLTRQADVGLSIEEDLGLNYRYALPNKIFDYIHAGVPVLVSDLPEMKKIIEEYRLGKVLYDRNPQYIARLIKETMAMKGHIDFDSAKQALNWEKESLSITEIFRNLQAHR